MAQWHINYTQGQTTLNLTQQNINRSISYLSMLPRYISMCVFWEGWGWGMKYIYKRLIGYFVLCLHHISILNTLISVYCHSNNTKLCEYIAVHVNNLRGCVSRDISAKLLLSPDQREAHSSITYFQLLNDYGYYTKCGSNICAKL